MKVTELKDQKEEDGKNKSDEKEIDIPAKAAKSVKAIKALYPDAVIVGRSTKILHRVIGSLAVKLTRCGRWPVTVVP